jgi:hypothetical protein
LSEHAAEASVWEQLAAEKIDDDQRLRVPGAIAGHAGRLRKPASWGISVTNAYNLRHSRIFINFILPTGIGVPIHLDEIVSSLINFKMRGRRLQAARRA